MCALNRLTSGAPPAAVPGRLARASLDADARHPCKMPAHNRTHQHALTACLSSPLATAARRAPAQVTSGAPPAAVPDRLARASLDADALHPYKRHARNRTLPRCSHRVPALPCADPRACADVAFVCVCVRARARLHRKQRGIFVSDSSRGGVDPDARADLEGPPKLRRFRRFEDRASQMVNEHGEILTITNGNCALDAVLASKQAQNDCVIVAQSRYVRHEDAQLRSHLADAAEAIAHDDMSGALFFQSLNFRTFAQFVTEYCGYPSLEGFVKRLRAVDTTRVQHFESLDVAVFVLLAIVDQSEYVIDIDGGTTVSICMQPSSDRARSRTRVVYRPMGPKEGHFLGSCGPPMSRTTPASAAKADFLPVVPPPLCVGGGLGEGLQADRHDAKGCRLKTLLVKDVDPYKLTRDKELLTRLVSANTKPYKSGAGEVASLLMADQTSDVQVTIFNQPGLYASLRVGGAYYVPLAKAVVKPKSKFNRGRLPFEITLGQGAELEEAPAAVAMHLPAHRFRFESIESLTKMAAEAQVDVLGIVTSVGPLVEYARKSDQQVLTKRVVEITDKTTRCVQVTIWGDAEFELGEGLVVALRGRVAAYNGVVALSALPSDVAVLRDTPEAVDLAEEWRVKPWQPIPLAPVWKTEQLDTLSSKSADASVDVLGVVVALDEHIDYIRKTDNVLGVKLAFEVSDATKRSVPVTLYMKAGETLALAKGMVVALRAHVSVWMNQLELRVFSRDAVTPEAALAGPIASEAKALAETWRTKPWQFVPVTPPWNITQLDALSSKPADASVDVLGVLVALDEPIDYIRKMDNVLGTKLNFALSDESARRVDVTLYMKVGETLALAKGMVVALRARTSLRRNEVTLVVPSRDGLTLPAHLTGPIVSTARALADKWRLKPWHSVPAKPRWTFTPLDALPTKTGGDEVDVLGMVVEVESPKEFVRKSDGSPALLQNLKIANADEFCASATIFMDKDAPEQVREGTVVALRGRIREWDGLNSVFVSSGGLVCNPEVPEALSLRRNATESYAPDQSAHQGSLHSWFPPCADDVMAARQQEGNARAEGFSDAETTHERHVSARRRHLVRDAEGSSDADSLGESSLDDAPVEAGGEGCGGCVEEDDGAKQLPSSSCPTKRKRHEPPIEETGQTTAAHQDEPSSRPRSQRKRTKKKLIPCEEE